MPADKCWSLSLFFDRYSTDDIVSLAAVADVVRASVTPEWAVWACPRGVVNRPAPHVALLSYLRLTEDPLAALGASVEAVDRALLRAYDGVSPVLFSGNTLGLSPAVDVNWAPGVRGTRAA